MEFRSTFSTKNLRTIYQFCNSKDDQVIREFIQTCSLDEFNELLDKMTSAEAKYILDSIRGESILQLQIKNLRKCFRENCVTPILGNNYYNMGMSVYCADELCTLDIKHEYLRIKDRYKLTLMLTCIYFGLFILMTIVNIIIQL